MDSGLRYGLLGAVWLGARAPWAAVGGIRSAAHFRYLCGPSLFEYFAERLEGGWRSVHRRPKTRCGRCSDPLVVLHLYVKIRPLPTLLVLPVESKHDLRPRIQSAGRTSSVGRGRILT